MTLLEIKGNLPKKKRKLLGRGNGSGLGTYSGKGGKGQTARSGGGHKGPGFEGGQSPIFRRMPKLHGFRNPNRIDYIAINVADLEKSAKNGEIDLTKSLKKYKLLGEGEIASAITVTIHKASASAIAKVEKAGGKVNLVKAKEPDVKKQPKVRAGEQARRAKSKA